jgi:hypothetical protein
MYTMEYNSPIKKNEIMFAGKWMELEILLSEISQTEKDKSRVLPLMWNLDIKEKE